MLSLCCRSQNTLFLIICSAEDLFTLNCNKFRMVYKVDGNPQLDSRDWSMYSNILKVVNEETYRNICDITHLINIALFENLSSKIYFKQLWLKWAMTDLERREILICSGKQFNKKSKTIQEEFLRRQSKLCPTINIDMNGA